MPTPLTASDEMIVPYPIKPEYIKPKPVKLNADSVYFAQKYEVYKQESHVNFGISVGIIILLIVAMVLLRKYYKNATRGKTVQWIKNLIKL